MVIVIIIIAIIIRMIISISIWCNRLIALFTTRWKEAIQRVHQSLSLSAVNFTRRIKWWWWWWYWIRLQRSWYLLNFMVSRTHTYHVRCSTFQFTIIITTNIIVLIILSWAVVYTVLTVKNQIHQIVNVLKVQPTVKCTGTQRNTLHWGQKVRLVKKTKKGQCAMTHSGRKHQKRSRRCLNQFRTSATTITVNYRQVNTSAHSHHHIIR